MKKLLSFLLTVLIISQSLYIKPVFADEPSITAPSAILMEASTGEIIYEKNADESLHPASITKIMTLLLIFDALNEGKIALTDPVTVSEYAASMGGSQVFLEPGEIQTVDTMIKCIAVASANDACVAMGEYIWGSEGTFVEKMNERATGLGMVNTKFVNCCGLDVEGHMTTARDVALMSRELITKYPKIHEYSTIWMDTIIHTTKKGQSEFGLTNTNKLIRQYEWATGLKTGSTSLAKFCLSATANKNGIELISVVMGANDGKLRVSDSIALLNYGYGICSVYEDKEPPLLTEVEIEGGIKSTVDCEFSKAFRHMFLENYDAKNISSEIIMNKENKAPISKGDVLGKLVYYYDDKELGSVDIISKEDMKKAKFFDCIGRLWQAFEV